MNAILLKLRGLSFVLMILVPIMSIGCTAPEVSKQILSQASPPETLSPVQMKEDIDFLVKTLKEVHPNMYAYMSREDFESALSKTMQACEDGNMPVEIFYRHAAWLAGQLKNGHTKVYPPKRWHDYIGKVFPLFWKLDEDKVRLYKGPYLDKRHWGATVLTINGKPALEVMRYYSSLWAREVRGYNLDIGYMVKYLWRNMALDFGENELELELKNRNGQVERVVVKAVSIRDAFKGQKTTTGPVKWSPVTYSYRDDCQTGLMKIRSFGDAVKFREEIKNAFSDLKAKGAKNLIIDVRGCPGGNTLFSDELLGYLTDKEFTKWQKYKYRYSKLYQQQRGKHGFLIFTGSIHTVRPKPIKPAANPLRFKGDLYILIDRRTGSTAVDFAGLVKYYKLGMLIGQETGDTMASYGDILSFKLPNSQLAGIIACKYYEITGTTKDNAMQGVKPDHYVGPLLEDTWDESDRVMKFVHELCSCD